MAFTDVIVLGLVGLLIGVFPAWPYSRGWGYYPSGGVSLMLFVFVVYLVAQGV